MKIKEQVIIRDGRIIRLAPFNMFPQEKAEASCPVLRLAPKNGFYILDNSGFMAYDVTKLWIEKHGE